MQLNYCKEYLGSQEHLWAGVFTLGPAIASASAIGFMVGAVAYAITWIYLPGMDFFRRKVDLKAEALTRTENDAVVAEFKARRDKIRRGLNSENQERYNELAGVCQEIESTGNGNDALFGKLDELMWTYLKLLAMDEAIGRFLEESKGDDLSVQLAAAQSEMGKMDLENPAKGSSRERLRDSRRQVLEVLQKRQEAAGSAADNLGIVRSEAERLGHQIRLLRAESVASRNSELLTAKINSSVETLQDTNSMLSQMSDYQEMIADMPPDGARTGYGEVEVKRTRRATRN